MTKYVQTKEELLGHLKEQIAIIKLLASSYDDGFDAAAKTLATHIRVLLYDSETSKSLLTQLNKKDIEFYDSAQNDNPIIRAEVHSAQGLSYFAPRDDLPLPGSPNNLLPYSGLTIIIFSAEGASYVAPLDTDSVSLTENFAGKILFNEWWEVTPVIRDKDGKRYTRKDLVLKVTNMDGGAHIDPGLEADYANLSRFNSLGWTFIKNGIKGNFQNSPVLPSIRQVAHEVLKTLQHEFLELFPDRYTAFRHYPR